MVTAHTMKIYYAKEEERVVESLIKSSSWYTRINKWTACVHCPI